MSDDMYMTTSMSDLDIEATERQYDVWADEAERMYLEYEEAITYIDEFKAIVINEEAYADLILAEEKIVEYQEVYINYKNNSNDELRTKIESLGQIIVDLSHKLQEQARQIPISEKKLITVKDFEELYSIQEETQRILRRKTDDPLPFTQIAARGNIYYNPNEVDKWLENYKKER